MVHQIGKDKGLQIEQCGSRAEKWGPVMIRYHDTVMGKQLYRKQLWERICGKAHRAGMIEKVKLHFPRLLRCRQPAGTKGS